MKLSQDRSVDFNLYTDEDLQKFVNELERRKDERKKKLEEDMEKRKVKIKCPKCNGHGQLATPDNSMDLGYPVTCQMCNGSRTIIAYRAN